jgi:ATP-dependent Zn protease
VIDDICIALAGRLAQEKRFPGEGADIGASSDLQKASTMAYLAVTEWGLDPEFCPLSLKGLPENPVIQAIATAEALPRVRHMLAEAQSKSRAIIDEYWVKIESVAIWLQAEGTMEGKMLVDLMSGPKTPT